MVQGESARYWSHPAEPSVDLLRARYVTHSFGRHSHAGYAIGVVCSGVEEFHYGGSLERAAPGGMPLVNPEVVHTGHAGVPTGWTYRVLYPSVQMMTELAGELGGPPGTPSFDGPVVYDAQAAHLLIAAHRAADTGEALAASSLLRLTLATVLRRYATTPPPEPPPVVGRAAVRRARDLLHARMSDPPGLPELAAAVGARPFALARAFRDTYGLPPHAYLNQQRIRMAQRMLTEGTVPADVAHTVGFVDQAHLNRHFRRIVGVPPGMYQRGRDISPARSRG